MSNSETIDLAHEESQEQISFLKIAIAKNLQTEPGDIQLVNEAEFTQGKPGVRFLYGFTTAPDNPPGFFKWGQKPELATQLRRESRALEIAALVGIPTVAVLRPAQTTPEGATFLLVESLNGDQGTILVSSELIAAVDLSYGRRAALVLINLAGKELPADLDTSLLKRDDWRTKSLETFWKVWEEQGNVVFNTAYAELVENLIGAETLREIVDQTRLLIEPLLNAAENPDVEYFVHGDTAPGNMYFGEPQGPDVLLDFEYASATHNSMLAQITDLGNYYGRMWPNPAMQQEFLTAYLGLSTTDQLDYNHQLLQAVVVFGSMFQAKYAMSPDHHLHQMAKSLLSTLTDNLAILDHTYNILKEKEAII